MLLAALLRARLRRPRRAESRALPARSAWFAFGTAALVCLLLAAALAAGQQSSEELLNRVSDPKLQAYEELLAWRIKAELARYIGKNQFVLSVKVLWNPEMMPVAQNPALAQGKQKLPGFPISVGPPNAPPEEEFNPPFTSLTVRVLLDDTLPEYYERFVRKVVPIVARFDSRRGDQVIVVKETFPPLKTEARPATLAEKELMDKVAGFAPAPQAEAPPQDEREKLAWGAGVLQWPRVTGYLYSRSHGQRLALVRATPPGSAALRIGNAERLRERKDARLAAYPAGTILAMQTWEIDPDLGRGAAGPLFFMRKEAPGYDPEGGDWRYAMTRSDLGILAEGNDGPATGCRSCHLTLRDRDFVADVDR